MTRDTATHGMYLTDGFNDALEPLVKVLDVLLQDFLTDRKFVDDTVEVDIVTEDFDKVSEACLLIGCLLPGGPYSVGSNVFAESYEIVTGRTLGPTWEGPSWEEFEVWLSRHWGAEHRERVRRQREALEAEYAEKLESEMRSWVVGPPGASGDSDRGFRVIEGDKP